MTVALVGIGGLLLILLGWSGYDLGRHSASRSGIAVVVGIAVPALIALAITSASIGSWPAIALPLAAAAALPLGLAWRRPRRGLQVVAATPRETGNVPVAVSERRAA
jgi:hypothetical protein